jgi:hypothetical protein
LPQPEVPGNPHGPMAAGCTDADATSSGASYRRVFFSHSVPNRCSQAARERYSALIQHPQVAPWSLGSLGQYKGTFICIIVFLVPVFMLGIIR